MTPEGEALQLQVELQQRHVDFVCVEINLIGTFLDLSRTEYGLGEVEAGAKTLFHAQQAIDGARRGVCRITSPEQRELLGDQIDGAEAAVQEFDLSRRPL